MGIVHVVISIVAIGLIVAFPWSVYELNRYYKYVKQYEKRHWENQNILESTMCTNGDERIYKGEKIQQLCKVAELENQIEPRVHAYQSWWQTSELVALYQRIAGERYIVVGIVLFTILCVVYFGFNTLYAYWVQTNRDNHMIALAKESFEFTKGAYFPKHLSVKKRRL